MEEDRSPRVTENMKTISSDLKSIKVTTHKYKISSRIHKVTAGRYHIHLLTVLHLALA